ncbi:MAG TPA: acyltransferase [Fimbriimonadaceae bacterium]|nr:acyltransferase [Fimbriimonadaceae bacterium]
MSARLETTSANRSVIPGLDGIRAMAVLTVFLFHAQIIPHVPGELATTVFFFLSGYLITTLFVREHRKTGSISLGGFYYRRALRTLPPLFVALLLALGVHFLLGVGEPLIPWKAAGNFLNYTNYGLALTGDNAGFLPGTILLWSLAVDEHYYLLFAPAFRAAIKRVSMRTIIWGILLLCAVALAWRIWLVWSSGDVTYRETMASDTRMDSILWGSLLALWRNPALEPNMAKTLTKPFWVLAGAAGLVFVEICRNRQFVGTFGFTIEGLAMIPLFALAIQSGGKGALKFLQWPWLLWVSRASYPLYLLQWIMISTCEKYVHAPRLAQMAVAAALTLGLGAAMHYGLERPILAMRKRRTGSKAADKPNLEAVVAATA